MFTVSAELYDAIYAFKDYAAEAARVAALVRSACPGAQRVLDVACGTGEHTWRLARDHGFEVDGLDREPGMLVIARRKHPTGRFFAADMGDFALGRRYDAILCLFSSIGYLRTLERVRRAFGCFRDHLAPAGVVLVEPWFEPGAFVPGRVHRHAGEGKGFRVERVSRTEVEGRVSRLRFEYRVEGPEGARRSTEVHELGLFTQDEMQAAFRGEGLSARFEAEGASDRGVWVARASASA